MIGIPDGFHARYDHGVLVLAHAAIELRYVERLRPVISIEALWGSAPSTSPPRPFVTHEGEYAWILDGVADADGDFTGRVLGAVIGDDFLAVLEAITHDRASQQLQIAIVDDLLRGDVHMLGVRRRPYLHAPPDLWRCEQDPFHTTYTRDTARIAVLPAMPRTLVTRDRVVAAFGLPADCVMARMPGRAATRRWSGIRDNDRCVEAFLDEDADYFYPAIAECSIDGLDTTVAALESILETAEPIPLPRTRALAGTSLGAFRRALATGLHAEPAR